MILLFKLIILTVIIVLALKVSMADGMIFENVGKYFTKKVDKGYKIFDLFICPFCMNTLQSITAHAFAFGLGILPFECNWQLLIRWPIIVFGASVTSGFIWTAYETINRIKESNEAEADWFNLQYDEKLGIGVFKNKDKQKEVKNES